MAESLRICRCCLSDGCYKDIGNEYYFSGQKEIYADLLLTTFNVTISTIDAAGPSNASRLICDTCIQRLRDAAAFKQQVVDAENNIELLLRQLNKVGSPLQNTEKETAKTYNEKEQLSDEHFSEAEPLDEYVNYDVTDDVIDDNVGPDNDLDDDLDLKDEMDDQAMNGFDEDQGELFVIKLLKNEIIQKIQAKKITNKKPKRKIKLKEKKDVIQERSPKSHSARQNTSERDRKMKENTSKLVLNSNMCLFKSLKVRFQCLSCADKFIFVKELRRHCEENHKDNQQIGSILRSIKYKHAEISNLICKLCEEKCEDIDDLQRHLTDKHDFSFESEGHLIVPYRIEKDYNCVICKMEFHSFLRLRIHMNAHSTKNMCENCGASFLTGEALRIHARLQHRPRRCVSSLRETSKVQGRGSRRVVRCLLCEATFKYFYQLYRHKTEAHGTVRRSGYCADCNKSFISPANLRVHIRSVHLRERNYNCTTCGSSFFTKTDLKRHERTHSAAPALSCDHCASQFKSKDSWRRHMNRQHPNIVIKKCRE